MLRKRSRSVQKDQYNKGHLLMSASPSDSCLQIEKLGQKQKNTSFFSVPGLFVGFNLKGISDCDSVRSPTSPLDFKVVSNLGSKISGLNGSLKSWDCPKVGLGILDVLDLDHATNSSEILVQSAGSRNILFGSQIRMMNIPFSSRLFPSVDSLDAPKSLPNNYAMFPQTRNDSPSPNFSSSENSCITGDPKPLGKFQSYLSDSSRSMSRLSGISYCNYNSSTENFCSEKNTIPGLLLTGKATHIDDSMGMKPSSLPISIVGSLSASDIELSEDYTCIISHGPNPRTTHIFGDCVLDCHENELTNFVNKKEEQGTEAPVVVVKCSNRPPAYPSDGFLSFCFYCKKKLEEGNDIYMYRGEKSFCSSTCRDQGMLDEEEVEKLENDSPSNSPKSTCSDDIFTMGI